MSNYQGAKEICDCLLSTTTVSHAAAAQTTLYTVPTGKRCVLTKCIIIAAGDEAATDITIGQTASWDDFVGANGVGAADMQLDNLDAQYDVAIIGPDMSANAALGLKSYAAGTAIKVDVVAANGNAANTYMLFGILYDA